MNIELKACATILEKWARNLPLKQVYIFGSRVRGDATSLSDIDVAIEFENSISKEAMLEWEIENDSDFADLKTTLGCPLSLHAEKDDVVWPFIRESSKNPIFSIGKVVCILTPSKISCNSVKEL